MAALATAWRNPFTGLCVAWLTICFFSYTKLYSQDSLDIVIKQGYIIDGTGKPGFLGDIGISKQKIVQIQPSISTPAKRVIYANQRIVCPGFIDIHTHIEGDELLDPFATNFIADGVTSVITGNCGESKTKLKAYFSFLDSVKMGVNVGSFIGHNDVRKQIMGTAMQAPTATQLANMQALVEQGMKDGAFGFSTGLIYIPGTYSTTNELISLAQVIKPYHGIYVTHMRNETDSVVEAVNEAVQIAQQAQVPIQISHLKMGGKNNWNKCTQVLQLIEAYKQSQLIDVDIYPYTASSTSLTTLLPSWVLSDHPDSLSKRLANPTIKQTVVNYMLSKLKQKQQANYNFVQVASNSLSPIYNGKKIPEITSMLYKSNTVQQQINCILKLIVAGSQSAVFHSMSEQNVQSILAKPYSFVASDGTIRKLGKGHPHPRSYGTNTRVLYRYVKQQKLLSWEAAIAKMTYLPAQKLRIKNRGILQPNTFADIVIIDTNLVADKATYAQPHQLSTGIAYSIINGTVVWDNGTSTGLRNGAILKPE